MKCSARAIDIRLRKVRECGKPATKHINGRDVCPRHYGIAKQQEQVAKERAER